ncbi:terminase large subunit [Faecalibaculum rodentium]|uniref:terminase large subunit n=1 Tax=Faecalibaculum rodentium TaxID=1702221 RepID=UPI001F58E655|nr:terminase TerL endonuclease subunit [Faecalibaculum rodentium]
MTLTTSSLDEFTYLQEFKQDIADGKYVLGQWMQLNIQYVEKCLSEGKCLYDPLKAEKKIRFIETQCRYVEGRSGPFLLESWQKYIVACIFGLVDEDGFRHFTEIVLIIGRKQGKSTFAAALEMTIAYTEPELGMQLYNLAPKLQQANIIYDQTLLMIAKNKTASKLGKKRRSDFYIAKTNTKISPLAFNSKKSDGFNPYFACFDEFAAWEGVKAVDMWNVMLSAQGGRHDPINLACSTANFIDGGLYDELFPRCTSVLLGTSEEENLLPFLFMIDDIQKWDDVQELKKALPNLGVSFFEKNLQKEIRKAHASPSYKNEFICKYCNIKMNTVAAWVPQEAIRLSQGDVIKPEDFQRMACVGGVDLSQTTDLTSACVVINFEGVNYVYSHFWIPAGRLKDLTERDNVDYSAMVSHGFLSLSGDKFVDYKDVTKWFVDLRKEYKLNILVVGYDRYSSTYFVDEMKQQGFLMDDVNQGTNLSPILTEFEGLIMQGLIQTGTNGLLQSHIRNTAIKREADGKRMRMLKISETKHIDGMAALIDALTVKSKYNDQYKWILEGNKKRE